MTVSESGLRLVLLVVEELADIAYPLGQLNSDHRALFPSQRIDAQRLSQRSR